MARWAPRLIRDRRGATAIEYGLILALIALALVSGLSALGSSTHGMWGNLQDEVSDATTGL
ncbi:MAG TPA: Flp family type IVb pilin [Sphingomonadaceae bacterium]|jgi:pilus assembly protein Flp/PilA|nr:Flp family type IVb pilin [Sphingomonadaceae bacterium]